MKKIISLVIFFSSFNTFADEEFCKDEVNGKCYCEKLNQEEKICKFFYDNGNPDFVATIKMANLTAKLKNTLKLQNAP